MPHLLNWNYERSKMKKEEHKLPTIILKADLFIKYKEEQARFKKINALLSFEEQTVILHALDLYRSNRTDMVKKYEKTQKNASFFDAWIKGAKENIETAHNLEECLERFC